MSKLTAAQIAGMMDISLLQPQFTRDDIDKLIDEAVEYAKAQPQPHVENLEADVYAD